MLSSVGVCLTACLPESVVGIDGQDTKQFTHQMHACESFGN